MRLVAYIVNGRSVRCVEGSWEDLLRRRQGHVPVPETPVETDAPPAEKPVKASRKKKSSE